jgi:hypothetical protein
VEAMADESVLGRFEDVLASLGVGGATSWGNGSYRHILPNENERSFSCRANTVFLRRVRRWG